MKNYTVLIFLILNVLVFSAQKIDKVKKIENKNIQLSQDDLKSKKRRIIRLIKLGYNNKTIRLKTNASIKQIKAIRKDL
tara:strand:- start:6654 stop:6890 length:237 start_codon:yes stop_codon:yes gene_type:complete